MRNKILLTLALLSAVFATTELQAQKVALKTNLLYGGYTYTPNLSLELALGKKSTIELGGGYNPWHHNGTIESNKKLVHWLGQAEYRYWFCEKFNRHFLGLHVLGTQYNIAEHKLPLLFGDNSQQYRFEGWGAGVGISYGYQWFLGKRWSIEATIGVGYAHLEYDKFYGNKCGLLIGRETRDYFGPTKAGVSLIFFIK